MAPTPEHPEVFDLVKSELSDRRLWLGRLVVLGFAVLAGAVVVVFTWLSEHALSLFFKHQSTHWWLPLIWTPLCTAAIVWITNRFAPGAAGSGIPQVLAALDPACEASSRGLFVSLKLTLYKILLSAWGLLAGLSLGREGPSVQVAAGVMHSARRLLPAGSNISTRSLLIAGGAAGIAAAFNTPLGGVLFAIEELAKNREERNWGPLLVGIVMAGLISISVYGNSTYFGIIKTVPFSQELIAPSLLTIVLAGVLGGVFSRLLLRSLESNPKSRLHIFRKASPVKFAMICGLIVAILGLVSQGQSFGSGYAHTKSLLDGAGDTGSSYVFFKFLATWVTAWSGVPGGIFAPSLAIGGGLGSDIAIWTGQGAAAATFIALGMAGFLAAVTQAPLTAFIIVMEMVDGHSLVLSLMSSALLGSAISRLISTPLYPALAIIQLNRRNAKKE